MNNHKEAVKVILSVLEEDYQFSEEERTEALLLALKILSEGELLDEPEDISEPS